MAGGVISGFGRVLAAVLHRIAVALENLAGRLSGPAGPAADQALASLAARFPGAPEHWLAYIAARAPHLAQGSSRLTEPATSDRRGRADQRAWPTDPPRDEPTSLRLDAAPRAPRPPPLALDGVDPRPMAPLALQRSARRPTPRPRLLFIDAARPRARPGPGDKGAVRPAAATLTLSGVGLRAERAPVGRTDAPTSARPSLLLAPAPGRREAADAPASWLVAPSPNRGDETPQTPADPRRTGPDDGIWDWGAWRRTERAGAEAAFNLRGPHEPENAADDRWPALPPRDEQIPEAPAPRAPLRRLRAEQDDSAWSG